MARILVVDEDRRIRRSLAVSLRIDGHKVVEADRAEEGVRLGRGGRFDLVILDCSCTEGQEIITAIHNTIGVPIIVLSTCAAEARKVEALDRGANDYVVKPFGIGELMARVRAVLRRHLPAVPPGIVVAGALRIDLGHRRVTRNGEEVHLTRREFDLLKVLASNPDHVLSHQALLRSVWGGGAGRRHDLSSGLR